MQPRAIELYFSQVLRRVGRAIESAILDVVEPRIAEFAAPESDEIKTKLDAPAADGEPGAVRSILSAVRAEVGRVIENAKKDVHKASETAGKRAVTHSRKEFERLKIKLRKTEPDFGPKIAEWRKENVTLIVSMSEKKVARIGKLLDNLAGMRVETLRNAITESVGAVRRQAELIARDQVLKINAQITEDRQVAAGIEEYIWTCSGDERVRGRPDGLYPNAEPSHWDLDGQRFKWSEPPVSGPNGMCGNPGEMFQCRCTAYPILPELEELDEAA